jgi:hypothetical protein
MPGLIISEESNVSKVSITENVKVNQISLDEESGIPNRIGLNGKSPFIGPNGNWFSYNDITRQPYDTGIQASDEEIIQEVDGLKTRVGAVENSINEILQKPEDIQPYSTFLLFPNLGKEGIIYIDESENKSYRWDFDNLKYYILNDESFDVINGGN